MANIDQKLQPSGHTANESRSNALKVIMKFLLAQNVGNVIQSEADPAANKISFDIATKQSSWKCLRNEKCLQASQKYFQLKN